MIQVSLCFLAVVVGLAAGCASQEPPSVSTAMVDGSRHHDQVIRDMQAEAAALRAEMATTRIAAAKKEAELQEWRRRAEDLRQTVEAKQAELAAVRAERDQLLQAKTEAQAQLAEVPQLRQELAHAKTSESRIEGRIKELESTVTTLASKIEGLKKEFERRVRAAMKSKQPPRSSPDSPSSPSARKGDGDKGRRQAFESGSP